MSTANLARNERHAESGAEHDRHRLRHHLATIIMAGPRAAQINPRAEFARGIEQVVARASAAPLIMYPRCAEKVSLSEAWVSIPKLVFAAVRVTSCYAAGKNSVSNIASSRGAVA
jgi:hypothetical protein